MDTQIDDDAAVFGKRLNTAQREAATFGTAVAQGIDCGPLLIIAGAGTGKTNTLAHRVAHLLLKGVAPERILLLTFTRRAAQEMLRRAERIARTLASAQRRVSVSSQRDALLWSGTYHSIGNRLLREYAQVVGLEPSFSVLDRGDAADLLDFLRQELGLAKKEKRFPRKDTCLAIYSHRVNSRQPLARTLEEFFPWCSEWGDELTQLFRRYVEVKHAQQLLDYDDLLLYWHILVQEPRLARDIGGRFEHVLIDEYQDTNTLQAEIVLRDEAERRRCLRRRRRRAGDLLVSRRDRRQHPGFSAAASRRRRRSSSWSRTIARCNRSSTRRTC